MNKLLYNTVRHLEHLAPQCRGGLCGNRGCVFYIEFLLQGALKIDGPFPAHSCLGTCGPTGPMSASVLKAIIDFTQHRYALEIRSRHPELFKEST